MIYMRDRQAKRRNDPREEQPARNYIDELKSKFARKNPNRDDEGRQENERKQNDVKPTPAIRKGQKYSIGRSKGSEPGASESKFSQSIIVHELPDNPNPTFSKRPLAAVKCFDIQILNDLSSSRFRAQAYIQILERDKELKNREILNLKELLAAEKERSPLCEEVEKLKKMAEEQTAHMERYSKFFAEGKDLFLTVVMELIDTRNDLSLRLTEQRLRVKQQSLSRCIERVERVISVYSNFVENKLAEEGLTVDQLWNSVKYQEKIIELMKQNESNLKAKDYHHENTLLRYEINRLSKHNEQLLKLINHQEDSLQLDYSHSYHPQPQSAPPHPHARPQQSIILHEQESDEIEEYSREETSIADKQTPFQQLRDHFSPSIDHPFCNVEAEALGEAKKKAEREAAEYKKRVGVLELEKEYVLDQLQQLQRAERELKEQLKAVLEENEQLREEARELKVTHALVQDSYEVAKESQKVMEEQNELLKDKINFIFKPNGKDSVTVEELLKLLKRKELAHYHQALMELINKYENRISDLTISQLYERELKQHSLTFCKGLFNIVQATRNTHNAPSLRDIIDYINQYEDIMAELKENQIDVYLRKIKSFSIGIDESSVATIIEELRDYVEQLQTRLPTLTEEYLEDGSSITDSHRNSVEKFD